MQPKNSPVGKLQYPAILNRGSPGTAVALLILTLGTSSVAADNTEILRHELSAERQKIAEQMQRLEQQMADYKRQVKRLDDLEERLDTAQATSLEDPLPAAAGAAVAEHASAAADSMYTHVAEQDQPAERLEPIADSGRQLLAAEGRSSPYLDENFTKSVPLFGSPWRFSFGGYAKVDFLHDFSGTGNDQEFVLSTIPVDDNPPEGSYSNLQISETRFHFETRNADPAYDNNRVYLEFDFFDEQNETSTRLRHAYVQYGQLLAGRTWTLLTELRQLPLILDFAGGDSILGGRTEQIRWTMPNDDKTFGWAVALENFNDSNIINPLNFEGRARSDLPRITAGFTRIWDRVVWSSGAALTQLRFDGSGETKDATEAAYTVTTAGRVYLDQNKRNYLGYGLGYQAGSVTDVITFANGRVPHAVLDADGKLDIAKSWNSHIALHWNWNEVLSSNFSYAYARLTDVPSLYDSDLIRTGGAYHANLIYKHSDLITAGVEFMHGDRENVSGRDGDAQRLQFSLFYYY